MKEHKGLDWFYETLDFETQRRWAGAYQKAKDYDAEIDAEILKKEKDDELFYGFLKVSVSDKKLSNLLYAIFITKSKLHSFHHLGLEKYTRKQNSGNNIDVIIGIKKENIPLFEELTGFKLKTSEQFQGVMRLNNNH